MNYNKEELENKVLELPLFEKRRVQVQTEKGDYVEVKHKAAICEQGKNHPYAFVGLGYNLLQFQEVFLPVIKSVKEEAHGHVISYGGFAILTVFPEMEALKDGNSRFGLVAMNSVDLSSSVIVKFCVEHQGVRISIPTKIAGLKKNHVGRTGSLVKDYLAMIGPVKQVWKVIIDKFPKIKIVGDYKDEENTIPLSEVVEKFNLNQTLAKNLRKAYEKTTLRKFDLNLWQAFVITLDKIGDREYKSEVHREKKIDALAQAIFEYSFALSI